MNEAKILTLDIETSPAIVYTWGLFDQNVGISQIVEPTRIICFAAKWLGEKKVSFFSEWGDGRQEMIEAMHFLLDEADVIISYNGKSFDIPHMNREMLEFGLTPPAPFSHVDLYQVIRRKFNFLSGKLDWVSQRLLDNKKLATNFDLWKNVLAGVAKDRAAMEKYCKNDVVLTEDLYSLIRSWIPSHPNVALIQGEAHACPTCAGVNVQKRGVQRTTTAIYQRYCCNDCGAYSKSGKSMATTALRPVSA